MTGEKNRLSFNSKFKVQNAKLKWEIQILNFKL